MLYIATSQDGFIADVNGNLDWLPQTEEETGGRDYGYKEFYDQVEALAIGRATYEQILGFGPWPYPGKKSYIFSSTPEATANEDIEFVSNDIPTFLKKLGPKKLWLVGGAGLAESFAKCDKIDEYIVTVFPVTLHQGIPLTVLHKSKLKKTRSIDFGDGVIQTYYTRLSP